MPIILDGTTGITTPGITNTGEFVFQGPIQVPAGSAASASVTTAAGPDTGIYFPSSSSIAITTAGTEKVSVGTGLVINDGGADFDTRIEGDTDANLFFVDASTDSVGIGTSSPGGKLEVYAGASGATAFSNGKNFIVQNSGAVGMSLLSPDANASRIYFGTASNNANAFIYSDYNGGSQTLLFGVGTSTTAATEKMRIDSSGNLGLGVSPSAWGASFKAFEIATGGNALWANTNGNNVLLSQNATFNGTNFIYPQSKQATYYEQLNGAHQWFTAPSGTAGNTITFTQAMTLDASGNLGVGTTSPTTRVHLNGSGGQYLRSVSTNNSVDSYFGSQTNEATVTVASNHPLTFVTNNTERARISSAGTWSVGTTDATPATSDVAGFAVASSGITYISATSNPALYVNRKTDDGELVRFYQAGVQEGSISVSGNTVSYNAFAGSHWSQLQDGSKPDILRGTVMESINELCVWPGEENERLPKAKISDTAGSKKVYGVFMAWDNDWTTTNDMYVTAVGAFVCRVNGSVTVQEGDLLESNGDGTARVQADDIIRSSTIGKVTSTVKTHQYDDGSYCVPTVLYCG